MNRVRCAICRQHLPTLKKLKSHYTTCHSKIQIVNELLKSSILNAKATPSLTRTRKHRKQSKYKTIYLHENVQITYSGDTIFIEDESSNDNVIELTFVDNQNNTPLRDNTNLIKNENGTVAVHHSIDTRKRRSKRSRKSKKLFYIGIKKITESFKSLDEHTGDFYECHCMEKSVQKVSSDTESGSDTGKVFYCNICGNGYHTTTDLVTHQKSHELSYTFTSLQTYRDHPQQQQWRVYVCHLCGLQFVNAELLRGHLGHHYEQQTFEDILDMEQEYNMPAFGNDGFHSSDYRSDINNILSYLTYPYDYHYSRNLFMKVFCNICCQELYVYEYQKHLRTVHLMH